VIPTRGEQVAITDEAIRERKEIAERAVYLIPACLYPEEIEEVVEDLFEEIFRRELGRWQPDEKVWPDTALSPCSPAGSQSRGIRSSKMRARGVSRTSRRTACIGWPTGARWD